MRKNHRIMGETRDPVVFSIRLYVETVYQICMQLLQLFLVGAESFFTVGAFQAVVGFLVKPFRMTVVNDLPFDQQCQTQKAQAPGEETGDKEKRGKHHGIVPVVDPAGTAALVVQKPGFKRTEKQNADHVTHGVDQTGQKQNTPVNDMDKVESADNAVESQPTKSRQAYTFAVIGDRGGGSRRDVILGELLLTPHTLDMGGEEAQHHFQSENQPDKGDKNRALQKIVDQLTVSGVDTVIEIDGEERDKQAAAKQQFDIVHSGSSG